MTNRLQMRRAGDGAWEIILHGDIGPGGITGEKFKSQLSMVPPGTRALRVRINSDGGDVFTGVAIYNMLRSRRERVEVVIDGVAASIASAVAMAGDEIVIPSNAFMMIHAATMSTRAVGVDQLREYADLLTNIGTSIIKIYSDRTGIDAGRISRMLQSETWLTADEAVRLGFADRIVDAADIAARVAPDIANAALPENQTPAGLAVADFRAADDTRAKMNAHSEAFWKRRREAVR